MKQTYYNLLNLHLKKHTNEIQLLHQVIMQLFPIAKNSLSMGTDKKPSIFGQNWISGLVSSPHA